ncbi:SDR family NAD(P)-dependent oxidoreductase [Nitrobacter sp.]|uniref:SDR family NAD(P)-dependent oxidoreductase n=1 Tax=Nitrobacter sp. TaxID=29420 RepID=UPI0029CAB285|nr:SDR family NAD(P)-dependent oxidoreductase [Nitrobacter sp.]
MGNGLAGKSIIVTGGGSGIGRSTALLIAQDGAKVTVADKSEDATRETASLIEASGGIAVGIRCDVTEEAEVQAMVQKALASFGQLHGAANVAGRPSHSLGLHELSREQWDNCIAVNLTGAFLCLKHQIPPMIEAGGGSIVIVSSSAAVKAYPGIAEYAASKAGVLGLARCAALEYGLKNIRVNTVLPGSTDTPMLRKHMDQWPELEAAVIAQHMLGRYGKSDELGQAVRWLLSDESSFVTGHDMIVDGGQTAG